MISMTVCCIHSGDHYHSDNDCILIDLSHSCIHIQYTHSKHTCTTMIFNTESGGSIQVTLLWSILLSSYVLISSSHPVWGGTLHCVWTGKISPQPFPLKSVSSQRRKIQTKNQQIRVWGTK